MARTERPAPLRRFIPPAIGALVVMLLAVAILTVACGPAAPPGKMNPLTLQAKRGADQVQRALSDTGLSPGPVVEGPLVACQDILRTPDDTFVRTYSVSAPIPEGGQGIVTAVSLARSVGIPDRPDVGNGATAYLTGSDDYFRYTIILDEIAGQTQVVFEVRPRCLPGE